MALVLLWPEVNTKNHYKQEATAVTQKN